MVETERLRGQVPRPVHLPALRRLLPDPQVAASLWPGELGGTRTDEHVQVMLDYDQAHWGVHGFGPWLWARRGGDEVIARGGLERSVVDGRDEVEILYAVDSSHWRQGHATEIARKCVDVAFDVLGLDEVVAFTLPYNVGSRRVTTAAGLAYERDIVHAGLPHVLYRKRRP